MAATATSLTRAWRAQVHLFDIDVPGGIRFQESETLSAGARRDAAAGSRASAPPPRCLGAGSNLTVVDTPWCKLGVGICYDLRFPLLSNAMRDAGAQLLVFPGAFNMTTGLRAAHCRCRKPCILTRPTPGPAHWELLQRARALDNQLYVVSASPARNPSSSYVRESPIAPRNAASSSAPDDFPPRFTAPPRRCRGPPTRRRQTAWGHSSVINPWGEVVSTCDHEAAIITADLDLARIEQVRYGRRCASTLCPCGSQSGSLVPLPQNCHPHSFPRPSRRVHLVSFERPGSIGDGEVG